jgi:hypothetical protein
MSGKDYSPDLLEARRLLGELLNHIASLAPGLLGYDAPVLDRTGGNWRQDEVLGFKRFIDTVHHQSDVLSLVSGSPT